MLSQLSASEAGGGEKSPEYSFEYLEEEKQEEPKGFPEKSWSAEKRGDKFFMESLILAQDERWRRA